MTFGLTWVIMSVLVSLSLGVLFWLVSFKNLLNREKSSPYECGFDPKGSARGAFSLRFFLLAVIFLVFDVEVVLLFPYVFCWSLSVWSLFSVLVFLILLLGGLFHEWREGSLEWRI